MLEVKRLLSMTRLLALTGSGGCGKTRLALEVERDLVGAYPDGVRLVELAALSEEALVPQAVAAVLSLADLLLLRAWSSRTAEPVGARRAAN